MNLPTSMEVAQRLADLSRQLDSCQSQLAREDAEAVRARGRYEVAFARSFLSGEGSVDARKQQARLDVDKEWLDAEIADQLVRATRSRLAVIRDQIEVGRSLGASIRAEFAGATS